MASHSSFPGRRRWLVHCLALAFAPAAAWAQDAPQQVAAAGGKAMSEVVISGSRIEQSKDDIPATVERIDAREMEEAQMKDIHDVADHLPNVSVRRAPARFGLAAGSTGRDGNAGFNIRGLDGNRVLMLVDGVRQPRSYVFGANAFGRDYVDLGLLERIEIVKGPASALYGSDGVAGLVNFITRTPESYLADGASFGGSAMLGYTGDDNGWRTGVTLAGRVNPAVEWLLVANVAKNHELENKGTVGGVGPNRTEPNPQDSNSNSLMGKVVLRPSSWQTHTLTYEHVQKKDEFDVLSGLTVPPTAATAVVGLTAENKLERDRFSWDGRWKTGTLFADELQSTVSYQQADSREYSFEDRRAAPDRERDTTYDEKTWQLGLQANKLVGMGGGWSQKLVYGLDFVRTDVSSLQTGLVPPTGETFPLKRFPDTVEQSSAVYIQDEIANDSWSIVPGLRFDHYKLDADQQGFAAQAVSMSDSAVSPKLGVIYRFTPQWSVYGNYARGFKAPNAFQVNNFFENVVAGYKTIPNPELQPETSDNYELGLRARLANVDFDAAVFDGRYKNFIEDQRLVGGTGRPGNPMVFQSVNIGRASIKGFELRAEPRWELAGGALLSLPMSYGQTEGTDDTTGRPLNSVDPQKATVGLRYRQGAWSVRADAVYHAKKKEQDIDSVALPGSYYAIPSATTLDIGVQWRIRPNVRLNFEVVNLTDKKYWLWADVRGGSVTAANIDAFTQPGRHANVSMVVDF